MTKSNFVARHDEVKGYIGERNGKDNGCMDESI
jgi:hypothetical protein